MALRAVPDHPKFAYLKGRLKLGKGATLGYLECVWHFTGRFTPQGNIGKYSDSEIENWVEWSGEPGALISALVEAKWLDRDESHRLIVHDWHQHADKATKLALKRGNLKFCTHSVSTCESLPTNNLLNKREAARVLGVSGTTVERLMRLGLPYIKLTSGPAGAVRFSLSDLNAFLATRTVRCGESCGDAA